ncbi:GGDEF domain-containing protein [Bordetella genomosp. 5]|uniref:bifunctional diguanylate cyclase/phosphodiesterase n=1 Tax=Bordetella genomosp. 5 TaxID=1395608 RepID=UPI000B9EB45D|nr:LapD/MoxY N-terminal periplasmic domain-containing protein [Bordetella genomosp. 5]OZI44561.1 GGDEF domain-containing protein [Bordetella genomosp. 5]
MSILRQLLLSVTLAIAVILLGALALNINAARQYLSGQLQVQSTDAAVSLALSLSQPANNDPVVQELLVSALFDGGHFSQVRLADPDGKTIVERQAPAAADGVPGWFKSLAPLQSEPATHAVSDGWKQIGTVTLLANDAYAWQSLWHGSLRMIALVAGAGALWALFAFWLVRWIQNRLLREISDQVRRIGQGAAATPMQVRVPELSGVVEALNQTRERIQASVEEQNAKIESLELEVNLDPVTGLPNRRYFLNELRRILEQSGRGDSTALGTATPGAATPGAAAFDAAASGATASGGHIFIFRQRDLSDLNRHLPREFIDQWLGGVSNRILASLEQLHAAPSLVGRLNGSDFAVLLAGCAAPRALSIAEQLRSDLHASRIPVGEGHLCRWALALADYAPGTGASAVLGRLDFGLMRAESAGDDHVVVVGDSDAQGPSEAGKLAWQSTLSAALAERRFGLATDMLRTAQGEPVRAEATLTLLDEAGRPPLHATLFIPPAVRLGLVADCDLQALELGLAWLQAHRGDLAVRVALPSLRTLHFLPRLAEILHAQPALAARLCIEVDAHGLVEAPEAVQAFAATVTEAGARVGLRRLAQQFAAVAQLHTVPLAYVKLGGGFVGGMTQSPGSQQLTASVLETARGLGIEVYAEDVPDAQTRRVLLDLGINVMRGPGVTAPA